MSPSYEELAALAVEQAAQLLKQAAQLAEQAVLIEALRVELEALATAGGPGLLELFAAAEHGRAGREGEGQGGPARGRPGGPSPSPDGQPLRRGAGRTGPGANRVGSRGIAAAAWPR